jgi:hypothetical protein
MQTIEQTIEDFQGIRTLFITDTSAVGKRLMVNVNDGEIVKYTGIYYKPSDNASSGAPLEQEATFIGEVECQRSRYDVGITGIYIIPLYIFVSSSSDETNQETPKWHKITNYRRPTNKYFNYPHLLMLPQHYYNYKPLYFTHTIENISLKEFLSTQSDIGNMEL